MKHALLRNLEMATTNRIRTLDFLRATAVLAMIFYHFVYDLGDFGYVNLITVVNGYWKLFAQSIGCSFLFLSGVSFWMMANKEINWVKYFKRLTVLLFASLLISLVTYLQFGQAFIFFGILHLLVACSILAILIYRLPVIIILALGIFSIIVPEYYQTSTYYNDALFSTRYLAWTGLYAGKTGSVDFYAFMPWSGAFIFGLALAKMFIKPNFFNYSSPLSFKEEKTSFTLKLMFWVGRNSLLVYLIHQPILYGFFYSFQKIIW